MRYDFYMNSTFFRNFQYKPKRNKESQALTMDNANELKNTTV